MKLSPLAALIALAAASAAHAGEITKVAYNGKFSLSQSCNPDVCTLTYSSKGSFSCQATITDSQISQFAPDTILTVAPGVADASDTYRLGDDPEYTTGDTSVSYERLESNFGTPLTVRTTIKWGKGKISVSQKISGKGTDSEPHVDSSGLVAPYQSGAIKHRTKSHDVLLLPASITADNSGNTFYESYAISFPDITRSETTSQKASIGEATEAFEATTKSKSFLAP